TSVGANYRGACRGRSKAEFISKLGTAIEEADESVYWLDMLIDAGMIKADKAGKLIDEANQLVAIFTASHKTASRNNTSRSPAVFNQKSAMKWSASFSAAM
ncbi:MAG TPA: four helix bundle protein, partial [Anaerolineales bacterium]